MIDTFEAEASLEILYVAAQFYAHDCLDRLLHDLGDSASIDPDEKWEICGQAVTSVFQDSRFYYHKERWMPGKDTYKEPLNVYVLYDPLLTRYDALCREYGFLKQISVFENTYATQMESAVHQAMQNIGDYSYDYLWFDGTKNAKGPKLVLFLGEEFDSYYSLPGSLFEILDFCKRQIPHLESELEALKLQHSTIPAQLKEAT